MVNLKDAIEIDKLTTGVDFEIISKEDNKKEEKEKEKADNLLYQERLLEHLNLDCMNFGEEVAKEEESMVNLKNPYSYVLNSVTLVRLLLLRWPWGWRI